MENITSLTENQQSRINLISANKVFKNIQVVNVGNVKKLENERKLPVNLLGTERTILAQRKHIEVYAENEFIWQGDFPNEEGDIFLNRTKEGLFGRIRYKNEIYSIEALDDKISLFLMHDNSVFTADECGTPNSRSAFQQTQGQIESRNTCQHLPIRIGVLFTQNAQNTGLNMNNIAATAINDLNAILSNSNININSARFQLAGVQLLPGFVETANIVEDIDNLPTFQAAQNFRNQTLSDVIVLLTAGDYANTLGIAREINAANANAYAIVQANTANANFTFAHEVVHVIGGHHQQCNINGFNCDNTPGFRHGFFYRTGVWPFRREWITLMHTLSGSGTRRPELSFPPDKGTATGNDNARMMRENACNVAQFRANPLSISINGPFQMPANTSDTWCVSTSNCPNVQSIAWQVSQDGWNYNFAGSGTCITQFFNGPYLYLQVNVACTDGQVQTTFLTVFQDNGFPLRVSNVADNTILDNHSLEVAKILTYPNPANSEFNISIEQIKEKPSSLFLSDWKGQKHPITYHYDENNNKISTQINSNPLISGIYFITCTTEKNIFSTKIIINHE